MKGYIAMLLVTTGCGLVGAGSPPDGPATLGKTPQRAARSFLPQQLGGSRDPVPAPAVGSGQCRDIESGGPVKSDGCTTEVLTCGETLVGHTLGGIRRYDTAFYRRNFCTPDTTTHDGGDERVYRLDVPEGDHRVVVTLDSPCADLDVAAMLLPGDECPGSGATLPRCEMFREDGTARERIELVTQHKSTWWVVVEGVGTEEGVFGLSVQCFDGLY